MHTPFEGELIRLRAREEEDEPLLFQWFNDPEVTQYLSMRYPLSHAQERVYIERNSEPGYGNANFAAHSPKRCDCGCAFTSIRRHARDGSCSALLS